MAAVTYWMDRTRTYLQGSQVDTVNRLAATYSPGDDEVVLEFEPKGVSEGKILSVGRACFMVWSVDATAKTVRVSPGWAGAQDVTVASGSIVRVNPHYPDHVIFDALGECLTELSSPEVGMYGVGQIIVPYQFEVTVYDLLAADGLEDILSIKAADATDSTDRWVELHGDDYELRRIEPTAEFPSGLQLRINHIPGDALPQDLYITYKRAFDLPGDVDTDIGTLGLLETAYDIPPLGAATRLAYSAESRRNLVSAQQDPRRAQEVPAGANTGAARNIERLYRQRVQQEYARLISQYGVGRL